MAQPEVRLKCGSVCVSIFRNNTDYGVMYSCNIQTTYKDSKSGQWKYSNNMNASQICVAQKLLEQAWGYIMEQTALSSSGGSYGNSGRPSDSDSGFDAEEEPDDDIPF